MTDEDDERHGPCGDDTSPEDLALIEDMPVNYGADEREAELKS
jgi:hypothetical protein